jgi:hypothetical protein
MLPTQVTFRSPGIGAVQPLEIRDLHPRRSCDFSLADVRTADRSQVLLLLEIR